MQYDIDYGWIAIKSFIITLPCISPHSKKKKKCNRTFMVSSTAFKIIQLQKKIWSILCIGMILLAYGFCFAEICQKLQDRFLFFTGTYYCNTDIFQNLTHRMGQKQMKRWLQWQKIPVETPESPLHLHIQTQSPAWKHSQSKCQSLGSQVRKFFGNDLSGVIYWFMESIA